MSSGNRHVPVGGNESDDGAPRIQNVRSFGNGDASRLMSTAPTASEIRLLCDGELSLPEAAAIEAKLREHPDAADMAGFDRELRKHVATVMKAGPPVPSGLADRIRAAIAVEADADTEPVVVARIAPPSGTPAHRAWWKAPLHANAFAVTASLVLVAGAVLFGIFGQPIDSWRRGPVLDLAAEAAAAVAGEHMVALGGPTNLARYETPEMAARELAPFLGDGGCVYDLDDMGYRFVGGDTCDVPGCDRGCHLLYEHGSGQPGLVSLHIVPRPTQAELLGTSGLDDLPLPTDKIPRGTNCPMDVLVWNYGDRCYLLSACISRDAERIALRMQQKLLSARP